MYFQHKGKRLHLAVWTAAHGPVPPGYHVHHLNHDRADNRLANLQARVAYSHLSYHGAISTPARREHLERARKGASLWHGSAEGLEWHRANGRATWLAREPVDFVCARCGVTFQSRDLRSGDRYCGNACRQAGLRKRRAVDTLRYALAAEAQAEPQSGSLSTRIEAR